MGQKTEKEGEKGRCKIRSVICPSGAAITNLARMCHENLPLLLGKIVALIKI